MKRQLVLSLALFLPAAMMAQNNFVRPLATTAVAEAAAEPRPSTSPDADNNAAAGPGLPQRAAPTNSKTAAADKGSSEIKRPKSEGSMVGYIDDATIGSKIRIRFDAAFDNPFPDRAEFFYGKCACYRTLASAVPAAFDPNAPGPGPGVPKSLNFQQLYFSGEYAPSDRLSFFLEVPFRWIQPQSFLALTPFSNQGGVSDVRLGAKLGLVASADTSVTFQFRSYLPSGDASRGLGTNHASIEPALLLFHKLSPRWSVEGQIGDWHPISGSRGVPTAGSERFAGDVFFYGIGPSFELYRTEPVRIAPVVELVGWHILGGFQTLLGGPALGVARDASGTDIVNMKFGVRTTLHQHNSIYVGYGRGLTDADWYRDVVRVEYKYVF